VVHLRLDLVYDSIEGQTTRALNAQKASLPSRTLSFTIVAHDIYNTLKICQHEMFGCISCTSFPCGCHAVLTNDSFFANALLTNVSLFANGAVVIKAGVLLEAMGVNSMTTWSVLRRLA
jgi:hypothetical protein